MTWEYTGGITLKTLSRAIAIVITLIGVLAIARPTLRLQGNAIVRA